MLNLEIPHKGHMSVTMACNLKRLNFEALTIITTDAAIT